MITLTITRVETDLMQSALLVHAKKMQDEGTDPKFPAELNSLSAKIDNEVKDQTGEE
jgi:hypothetical protein